MSQRTHTRATAQALKAHDIGNAHGIGKPAEPGNLQKLLPFLITTAFVLSGFLFLFAGGL